MFDIIESYEGVPVNRFQRHNNINDIVKSYTKKHFEVLEKIKKNHVYMVKETQVYTNGILVKSYVETVEIKPL